MKATYLSFTLAFTMLALLTSCGPDVINQKKVTSLTLSSSAVSMQQGETLQLTASVSPADAKVTYVTDNTSIASVSETGLVKALSPGTATITAKAGEKKATCTVTVVKATNVSLINKLDEKKYSSGSTIDYVSSISKDEAEACDLQLHFSVLKTMNYKVVLAFDKEVSGQVCLAGSCNLLEGTSYTSTCTLTADDEEELFGKEKGTTTPLGIHIDVSTADGGVYKNRLTLRLTPESGSEPLEWIVNLAITVK